MPLTNRTKALAALGAAGAAALVYATAIEPYQIRLVELELRSARLPREFDGYKILQISDLHMRKLGRREKLLQSFLEQLPQHDLAVITGDLIHTPKGTPHFLKLSKCIVAKDGVYAVFGNSEHKNGVRSMRLASELLTVGIRALVNEPVTISRYGAAISLLGVDDPASGKDDMRAAIKNIPEDVFKILLMHSPDPIGQACAYGIDVVLSGHTHGGQIKLPLIGAMYTNSVFGLAMDSGLFSGEDLFRIIGFSAGRTQLYVNRGVGVSNFAIRFLCSPEVTSITLRRI